MLLQLIAIPFITQKYGLITFGEVALASSIGLLLANLVNYGSNQTAVKDISIHRNDKKELSKIFSEIFCLRLVVFITITTITTIITITTNPKFLILFLSILPLIAAEVCNPLFFLIGIEKIYWISWGNLITRALSLCLVYFILINHHIAAYLNLMLSLPLFIYYLILYFLIIYKFELSISFNHTNGLRKKIKENFYVTFNGSSVVLQQSIFMFAAAGAVSPQTLGAYGIIDKLLGAVRQLVSAFSSAIYPRAALLYNEGVEKWIAFRTTIQKGYAVVCIMLACLIVLLSNMGSIVFTGKEDATLILFLKYFSLAPLALALNANNVLELLLKKHYRQMFDVSVLIIIATGAISFFLTRFFNESAIGLYPLIIESLCLLIYTFFLRRLKPTMVE